MKHDAYGDPEIETRIAQYEMAYRMQTSVPDLMDLSKEPDSVFEMYGPESRKPGTYAANCLLARRLAERDVRFMQLYHRGWDQHNDLPRDLALQCRGTDQPTAALITDLKQRGLLDDTLVVWGGEFGRTVFSQGKLTDANYGRDHHPRNFCMWIAGGGVKRGAVIGETDDFSYNVVSDPGLRLRSAGDDPASARHRSHEAHVPVPGTRLPPDRRAWRSGEEDPGVDAWRFERLGSSVCSTQVPSRHAAALATSSPKRGVVIGTESQVPVVGPVAADAPIMHVSLRSTGPTSCPASAYWKSAAPRATS